MTLFAHRDQLGTTNGEPTSNRLTWSVTQLTRDSRTHTRAIIINGLLRFIIESRKAKESR